ncbi:MAG: 50S ribosomal protein L6 [Deltaproteobacteria bacterium RIFOXYD12_FULL_50_9]|nr:MAG: 50S ribosomal protein L6 [Deltaproteobacteria bacterium RIFOXYD12_FULL_50_9]
MSRIGKKIISIPKGVKVDIVGTFVKVSGPRGTLERQIRHDVNLTETDGTLRVSTQGLTKKDDAYTGLTHTLVNNMITGVVNGFKKSLIIEGVGYRAEIAGALLTLNVGYSKAVPFLLPDGIKAVVEKTSIVLEGIDKELLGLTAARIRDIRKPEPYKGKGIRYDGEHITRKVGKSSGK